VNLIPLNPTPGYLVRGSSGQRVHDFREGLIARGVNRSSPGIAHRGVDAACGQLAAVTNARPRSIPVRSG
jgi:23S rRNA (adenine2503-C2)-methyltransferase